MKKLLDYGSSCINQLCMCHTDVIKLTWLKDHYTEQQKKSPKSVVIACIQRTLFIVENKEVLLYFMKRKILN